MIGDQLQVAIYAALTGANVAGGRVYDRPPESPTFPYVTIGDEQVIYDSDECATGFEVHPDVHVWSRPSTGSKVEVKTLVAAVVEAVTGISSVSGFSVVSSRFETSRVLRDPDGITEHAALTFLFVLDQN